jgi:glutathione peroxidase
MSELYDFEVTTIDGQRQRLEIYRGQALLIVNVASQCGFTPQYAGLEALYRQHHSHGLSVLGFPCDQFGSQEPGDDATIKSFCQLKYDVTFPLFAKVKVNGSGAHPLYQHLTHERRGFFGTKAIKWNFTKFLIDRKGEVRRRFAPVVAANRLERPIHRLLSESA